MVSHESTQTGNISEQALAKDLDSKITALLPLTETSSLILKGAASSFSELDLSDQQRQQYANIFDKYGLSEFAEIIRHGRSASASGRILTKEDLESLHLPEASTKDLAELSEPVLRGAHFVLKPLVQELKRRRLTTQEGLARKLEITESTLSRLLTGHLNMPVSTLTAIVSCLPLTEMARDSLVTKVIRNELKISYGKTDRRVFLALAKALQSGDAESADSK